jgi:hypothetical protein
MEDKEAGVAGSRSYHPDLAKLSAQEADSFIAAAHQDHSPSSCHAQHPRTPYTGSLRFPRTRQLGSSVNRAGSGSSVREF